MGYAVPAPNIPTITIEGSDEVFPVRRVYAVGRNYSDHAAETGLGGASGSVPGFSLKPGDSVVPGGEVAYPPATSQLDPEIEMVVAIGKGGWDISRDTAKDHIFGYAVGFDMIRRDVMRACIANEHSWDLCKSFDGASPCGSLRRASDIGHPDRGGIWIKVNGEIRQSGDIGSLIWDPAEIIARLSTFSRLEPGDIVFTGTPKGPGPVVRGDVLDGHIDGLGDLRVDMT